MERERWEGGKAKMKSSKTVTLIAFACQIELHGRTDKVKMSKALFIIETSSTGENNRIFHVLNYFRFFLKH